MKRPRPSRKLIESLCGNDPLLISSLHHSLYEVDLKEIYPLINFDDLIVFSASSWNFRKRNPAEFNNLLKNSNLYGLFSNIYRSTNNPYGQLGFPWFYHCRELPRVNPYKYHSMNMFRRKNLEDRLLSVDASVIDKIKDSLSKPVNDYVFECDYGVKKQGDNSNLILMGFQTFYPKKGTKEKRYAKEISRMLQSYPVEYFIEQEKQQSLF